MYKYKRRLGFSLLIVLIALAIILEIMTQSLSVFVAEKLLSVSEKSVFLHQAVLLRAISEPGIQVTDTDYNLPIRLDLQTSSPSFQNNPMSLLLNDASWSAPLKLSQFLYAPDLEKSDEQIQVWDAGYIDNINVLLPPFLNDGIAQEASAIVTTPPLVSGVTPTPTLTLPTTFHTPTPSRVDAVITEAALTPTDVAFSEPTTTDPSILSVARVNPWTAPIIVIAIIIVVGLVSGVVSLSLAKRRSNKAQSSIEPPITALMGGSRKRSFADLRDVLTELYSDVETIHRIASDAGINLSNISFKANAKNCWHSTLTEAENSGQMQTLLSIVHQEYGNNQKFQKSYEAYARSANLPILPIQ